MKNSVIAVARLSILSLEKTDLVNLQLANNYRDTAIYEAFHNDLSDRAKRIISDYSKSEIESAIFIGDLT